jgi:hypothetical protein
MNIQKSPMIVHTHMAIRVTCGLAIALITGVGTVQSTGAIPLPTTLSKDPPKMEKTENQASTLPVEFEAKLSTIKDKRLIVRYRITNRGQSELLLINRGDIYAGLSVATVYVEPLANGVVEVSQRGFLEPKDSTAGYPQPPNQHGFSRLKPGQSAEEEIFVSLPLQRQNPFKNLQPPVVAQMPAKVDAIRFCLGVLEENPKMITRSTNGVEVLSNPIWLEQQQLFCTPVQSLAQLPSH